MARSAGGGWTPLDRRVMLVLVLVMAVGTAICPIEGERRCSGNSVEECQCGMECDWQVIQTCASGLVCSFDRTEVSHEECVDAPAPHCEEVVDAVCTGERCDGLDLTVNECQGGACVDTVLQTCTAAGVERCVDSNRLRTYAGCEDSGDGTLGCLYSGDEFCNTNSECSGDQILIGTCNVDRCENTVPDELCDDRCTSQRDGESRSCDDSSGDALCVVDSTVRCGDTCADPRNLQLKSCDDTSGAPVCVVDTTDRCDDRCAIDGGYDKEVREGFCDDSGLDAVCNDRFQERCDDSCDDDRHSRFWMCQVDGGTGLASCILDTSRGDGSTPGVEHCDDRCATSKRIHEGYCSPQTLPFQPDAQCDDRFDPAYNPDPGGHSDLGYCIDECFDPQADVTGWSPAADGHQTTESFDRQIHKYYCQLEADGLASCADERDTDCFEQNFAAHFYHSPTGWSFSFAGNDGRVIPSEGIYFMRCETDLEEQRDKQCTYADVIHKCDDWCSTDGTEDGRVRDGATHENWLRYAYSPVTPPVPADLDDVKEEFCQPTNVECQRFDYCLSSDDLQEYSCTTSGGDLPEESKCRRDTIDSRTPLADWDQTTEDVVTVDYCHGGEWRQCTGPGRQRGADPCCSGEIDAILNITEMRDETNSIDNCRSDPDEVGSRACDDVRTDVGVTEERTVTTRDGRDTFDVDVDPALEVVATLSGHSGRVWDILADDDHILTASNDENVTVWERGGTWANLANLTGHTSPVIRLAKDATSIYTASSDSTVRVWENGGSFTHNTTLSHSGVNDVSVNGDRIAVACVNGTVQIWENGDDFTALQTLGGHAGAVTAVHIDPDYIISGGQDFAVIVRDRVTGGPLATLVDHLGIVMEVYSDGDYLYSASLDGTVIVRQRTPPFTILTILEAATAITDVDARADYVFAVVGNGTIMVWDRGGTWDPVNLVRNLASGWAVSSDVDYIYATPGNTGSVRIPDLVVETNTTFEVNLTSGGSMLSARFELTGSGAPLPSDITLDVGSDDTDDWSRAGVLSGPVTTGDLSAAFQAELDACVLPEYENCTINVTLSFQNGGTVAVTDIDLRVMVFRQPPGVEIPGYVAGRLDSDVTAGGRTRNQVCGPFPEYDDATECCMTSAQVLQCTTAINTFNLNAIEDVRPATWCDDACGNVGDVFEQMHDSFKGTFECMLNGYCVDVRRGMCCTDANCHTCGLDTDDASCADLFDDKTCGPGGDEYCSQKCSTCFINATDLLMGTVLTELNNITSPFVVGHMRRLADNAMCDTNTRFCRRKILGEQPCTPDGEQLDAMGRNWRSDNCMSGVCDAGWGRCDNESMRGGWYLRGLDAVPAVEPEPTDLCDDLQGSGIIEAMRDMWCGDQNRVNTLLDIHFVANYTNVPCLRCPDLVPPPGATMPPDYYGGGGDVEETVITQGETPIPEPAPEGLGSFNLSPNNAGIDALFPALVAVFLIGLHRLRV